MADDKIGSDIQKTCIELVRQKGLPMHMHTPFCVEYKNKHENCFGCESHRGCDMVVELMLVFSRTAVYPGRWKPEDNAKDIRLILEGRGEEVDFG
jgi:hypothetical protein